MLKERPAIPIHWRVSGCNIGFTPPGSLLTLASIIRDSERLPSAPKVIPRLLRLLEDGNSSSSEVSAFIRLDPGIASRVLRVANSIYYGKAVRINSVEEAVTRIGYDQVFEIVSAAAASLVMDPPLPLYSFEQGDVWARSVTCALAGEALASRCGLDRNIAYATGLLHNVGMVVLDAHAGRCGHFASLGPGGGFPDDWQDQERLVFGFTQAELGAELLASWEFPRVITLPVRHQYAVASCLGYRREAALLHVAKWISTMVLCSGAPPRLPARSVLEQLALSSPVLIRLAGEVRMRLLAVRHLLEIS